MSQYGTGLRSANPVKSIYPGKVGKMLGVKGIPGTEVQDGPETLDSGAASAPVVVASQPGFHPSTQRQIIWRIFGASGTGAIVDNVAPHLGTAAADALLAPTITNSDGASTVIGGGNIDGTTITAGSPPWTLTSPTVVVTPITTQHATDLNTAITYYEGLSATQALTTADIGSAGTQHSTGAPNGTWYPGVYVSPSSIDIATAVTLDAQGNPDAVFVFYATASTITQSIAGKILLVNGAQACNVVWLAGSSFTSVGAPYPGGALTQGNILAAASITLGGGTLNGRALAVTAVTISTATVITVASGTAATSEPLELQASVDEYAANYVTIDTSIGSASPEIRCVAADNSADLGPDLQVVKKIVSSARFFRVFNPNGGAGSPPVGGAFTGSVDICCQ